MQKVRTATVSFSVDVALRDDLNRMAKEQKRSKSDLFREMYNYYQFKTSLRQLQERGVLIAERLGLETDDDVYDYIGK